MADEFFFKPHFIVVYNKGNGALGRGGRLADICTGARMKWLEVSVRASKNNKTTDLNPVEVNFSGTESRDVPDPDVKAPV